MVEACWRTTLQQLRLSLITHGTKPVFTKSQHTVFGYIQVLFTKTQSERTSS